MRQIDQNKLNMWRTVLLFLKGKEAFLVSNKPFSNAVSSLNKSVDAALEAMLGQTTSSTGYSRTKETLSADAVDRTMRIAKCALALADETGDELLRASVSHGSFEVVRLPQAERVARLRSIVNAAAEKGEALKEYGLGEGDYRDAGNAIDAFLAAINAPRAAIVQKATITSGIKAVLADGAKAIATMDKLIHVVAAGQDEFERGYKAARVIVHAGTRHNIPPAAAA